MKCKYSLSLMFPTKNIIKCTKYSLDFKFPINYIRYPTKLYFEKGYFLHRKNDILIGMLLFVTFENYCTDVAESSFE